MNTPFYQLSFSRQKSAHLLQHLKTVFLLLLLQGALFSSAFARDPTSITVDGEKKAIVSPEGKTYQWFYNGQKLQNKNERLLTITKSGTYRVETTDASGKKETFEAAFEVNAFGIRKIYIIGDSTVMTYTGGTYYPWAGWGQILPLFFNTTVDPTRESIQFDNRAIGGRSSKSFYEEGRWAQVLGALLPGDFVLIQFGHNDRDFTKPERYADTALYKSYLRKYVNESRLKGAFPVLITPMNMNTWFCDVMREVFRERANDYRGAMIQVAEELSVPYIDLNIKSKNLFEKVGRDYTTSYYFMTLKAGEYPNYPNGYTDFTHFQEAGATEMARLVLEGIKEHKNDLVLGRLNAFIQPEYKVAVKANDTTAGLVTQTATYPKGAPVTIKAIPNPGYQFSHWTIQYGNQTTTNNNKLFTFAMDSLERNITATFSKLAAQPLVTGTYRIYLPGSFSKTNQNLEVFNRSTSNGAAVIQNPTATTTNQLWNLRYVGDGYYTLTAVHSGKAMDVAGNSMLDGAKVNQFTPNPAARNQLFKLESLGNNTYRLIARHSGKYLQVATEACGANLVQASLNTQNLNQQFLFELVTAKSPAAQKATNPFPLNEAQKISPENIRISWQSKATAFNLYTGTSADNLTLTATGITDTTYTLTDTLPLGKFYWKVDAMVTGDTAIGDTWFFVAEDTVPPIVVVKNLTVQLDSTGSAVITPEQVDNGTTDAYGIAKLELSRSTFDCSSAGKNTIEVTATDQNGNVASSTAIVTVVDAIAPIVQVKNISVTLKSGVAEITPLLVNNGSFDQCGIKALSLDKTLFDCTTLGEQVVTLTVTDNSGNTSSAQAVVMVEGQQPSLSIDLVKGDQTFTGEGTDTLFLGYGAQSITLSASNRTPGATNYDWSPQLYLSGTQMANPRFSPTAAGMYTPTVTATNEYGCTASLSTRLTVIDVRCGDNANKVELCHFGNTLCLDPFAVQDHLSHGCKLDACAQALYTMAERTPESMERTTTVQALQVSPNPSRGKTTIRTFVEEGGQFRLDLYSAGGILIKTISTGKAEKEQQFTFHLNTGSFSSGVYLLRLNTAQGVTTQRLLVQ